MLLTPANGPSAKFPALAREVYDVSGAGDTVAAVLAAALGSGASISEAVEIANIAAGIVVGRAGTAVVDRAGIVEEVRRRSATGASDKIFERAKAAELARNWTESGLCVGFTNGCFDLLHPGHLKVLEAARANCDRLLVGLNSDQSVRRLKGETRPVQDEMARALVLASLACVDGVVIFGEDTPAELIRCLRPGLLVKGGEYKPQQVAGADLVRKLGRQAPPRGNDAGVEHNRNAGQTGRGPGLSSRARPGSDQRQARLFRAAASCLLVTRRAATIHRAKLFVAIAAAITSHSGKKGTQALNAGVLSDHQECRSATWAFHGVSIGTRRP